MSLDPSTVTISPVTPLGTPGLAAPELVGSFVITLISTVLLSTASSPKFVATILLDKSASKSGIPSFPGDPFTSSTSSPCSQSTAETVASNPTPARAKAGPSASTARDDTPPEPPLSSVKSISKPNGLTINVPLAPLMVSPDKVPAISLSSGISYSA